MNGNEWLAGTDRDLDLGTPWDSTHWSQDLRSHPDPMATSGLPFPAVGFDVDTSSQPSRREATGSRKWADDPSIPQDSVNRNPSSFLYLSS